MNPTDYVVSETERQHGTMAEAVGMYRAWERMLLWSDASVARRRPIEDMLVVCHGIIKEGNETRGEYRKVPAVFNQGIPAIPAPLIPRGMFNLCAGIEDDSLWVTQEQNKGYKVVVNMADYFTREFLNIHPFADGNGRVGSLLWNHLNGTLDDPKPMPYFFGEQ